MLTKIQWNAQHILWGLVCLIYLIFFRNFIFNAGMTLPLLIFFAVFFIVILILKEKIIINNIISCMIILPVIFISLNEYFLKETLVIPYSDDVMYFAQRYRKQFLYMLFFLVLPSILFFIKFKTQQFFTILLITLFISIGFNLYINISLDFNRDLLAQALSPVIHYDYGMIALSLLLICYGFYLKGTKSYLILLLTLINIFLIIIHGSRGAWIGLPIVFLMIFIFYWQHNLKKILALTVLPILLLIGALTLIPNSPIQQRLAAFYSDKEQITQSHNYDTSIGARLLLWDNALTEFKEAPFTGIGIVKLKQDNCKLYEQGNLSTCFTHAHNVYLQTLAAHGLFGLGAILFLFLAPLAFFIKQLRKQNNKTIYLLSVSGTVFIIYIMICSLTDLYFMVKTTTMLYYLVTVTLISLILKEKQEYLH
jgi:O-antigen ligase